jgi:hypothetical protein
MMIKKLTRLLIIAFLLPLYCFADVLQIKDSAPEQYVVKKGDTLWDISNLYLDKPWLWPELWRNNVHITNPHLIYPGDELRLVKNSKGEVSLEVVREAPKAQIKLSPEGNKLVKSPQAIPALPWSVISPYVKNEMIMTHESYERHPYVLGNDEGAVRYYKDNLVLGKQLRRRSDEMRIIRKQNEVFDMQGKLIGLQVRHLARAKVVKSGLKQQSLLKIKESSLEIKRGDRIIPYEEFAQDEISLSAAEEQTGFIIDDLEQHNLLGRFNVVVLDLGDDQVSAGTVMGIYTQGPRIVDGYTPKYEGESDVVRSAFEIGDEIEQPALKVGEVIVFKTFDAASYALITESAKVIKRGMIVAKP